MDNKKSSRPIVALVYDFDGTLSPSNMQEYGLLQDLGYSDPHDFWNRCDDISQANDAGGIVCVLYETVKEARERGVHLTRERLQSYGKNIPLFPGVESWFGRINAYGDQLGLNVQHFINSSGFREIIEGSKIASEFEHIYACSFLFDQNGEACWPGAVVDYTKKTQFIFKINKGIREVSDKRRVNEFIPREDRAVPFQHMLYFGDGETDIPSMRTIKAEGGFSIAVYSSEEKQKLAHELLEQKRVNFASAADYSEGSQTEEIVKRILDKIHSDIALQDLSKACAVK